MQTGAQLQMPAAGPGRPRTAGVLWNAEKLKKIIIINLLNKPQWLPHSRRWTDRPHWLRTGPAGFPARGRVAFPGNKFNFFFQFY